MEGRLATVTALRKHALCFIKQASQAPQAVQTGSKTSSAGGSWPLPPHSAVANIVSHSTRVEEQQFSAKNKGSSQTTLSQLSGYIQATFRLRSGCSPRWQNMERSTDYIITQETH